MPEHLHYSQEILLSQSVKMNLGGKNMRWGGGSKKTKEAYKPKRLQGGKRKIMARIAINEKSLKKIV